MKKTNFLKSWLMILCLLLGTGTMWAESTSLTQSIIYNAGAANNGYANWSFTDDNSNTWSAYAIKNKHSNATSSQHYLQIKKYANSTAYYIQVPTLGAKITQIKMTVSSSNQPMTGGGNSATLYFSNSNSTSSAGTGIASGTGASSVTIDASSLNLNSGYITASAAVRIWDVVVTYENTSGDPQISNFIKNSTLNLETGAAAYDVRQALNIPEDYTGTITTTIDGQTSKAGEFSCVYPNLSFDKTGSYTLKVTAAAVSGKYSETTGNISITVTAPLPTGISAIRNVITSTDSKNPNAFTVRLTDAVVTYVNGSNTYIEDENNALLIYKSSLGLTVGKKINGIVTGTGYIYNGLKEANAFDYSQATITDGGVVPCTTVSIAEIAADIETYESRRVKVEGLTITAGMDERNATATQGSDEINIREQVANCTGDLLAEGAYVYDMIAFPARYNATIQLGAWRQSDITMGATVNLVATDGDYYYATYSGTSTFKVPADLIVEEIGINNDGTLNRKAYNTSAYVPANTGVLIYSDEPGVHGFALSDNKGTSVLGTSNLLRAASIAKETDGSYLFYKLAYASSAKDDLGFYWGAENGGVFTSREGSAYLAVPAVPAGPSAPVRFVFGAPSVVTSVENAESATVTTKTLVNGQLYIVREGKTYDMVGNLVK